MKTAFAHVAAEYDAYRPSYPPEVIDHLQTLLAGPCEQGHGATCAQRDRGRPIVVDVGAGTGIFARQMAARRWRVVAVEPSAAMLRVGIVHRLAADAPPESARLHAVAATAECLPMASESVDLVTAAQAFHWFNPPIALAEFARVLRPGGAMALLWNNRDRSRHPIVDRFEELIRRYNPAHDREYRDQDWPAKIAQSGRFHPTTHHRIEWEWCITPDQFVGFSRTISYVRNVIRRDRLTRFEDDLRNLALAAFPCGVCRVPMWTGLWTARRLHR